MMTKPIPAPTVDAETTTEYAEGCQAFLDVEADCPYVSQRGFNNNRYCWFVGYHDARRAACIN